MGMLAKLSSAMLIKLVGAALMLAVHFQLARILSVSEFGLFSLASTVLLFGVTIAKQGFDQVMIRQVAVENGASRYVVFTKILTYAITSSTIILGVFVIFSEYIAEGLLRQSTLSVLLPVVGLTCLLQVMLTIGSSYFKAIGKSSTGMLFSGTATYFVFSLAIYLMPVENAFECFTYLLCSAMIALLFCIIGLNGKVKLGFSKQGVIDTKIISASRVLFVISLATILTQQLSILVLAKYSTLEDVANLSLAIKVVSVLTYPLIVINAVLAPRFARIYASGDIESLKALYRQTRNILFFFACLLCLAIFFSKDLIVNFVNPEFQNTSGLIVILLVGHWVNLSTGSVVSLLIMSGYERLHRKNTLILTSVNIALLFIVVPSYGVYGAAWVTAIAMATKNLVSLYYVETLILKKS